MSRFVKIATGLRDFGNDINANISKALNISKVSLILLTEYFLQYFLMLHFNPSTLYRRKEEPSFAVYFGKYTPSFLHPERTSFLIM